MYALNYGRVLNISSKWMFLKHLSRSKTCFSTRPNSSLVLSKYIRARNYPHWTSFFIKYSQVVDDLYGKSHFNWKIDGENYHVLRTGCWPFIKFHCTKRPYEDLSTEDQLFTLLKIINFGFPCLVYGVGSYFLIKWIETVDTEHGKIMLYFLYKENADAKF